MAADGRTVVFIVRNQRIEEVAVTRGKAIGDLIAIASDVKSGEKAVLRPAPELRSGTLVK